MFLHWTCVSPERHQRLRAICEHTSHLRDICDYVLCACETVSFRYVKYLLMLCSVFKEHVLITEVIRSLCEHVICFKVYVHVHEIMHSFTSIASFACLLLHQRWTSCFKGFRNIKRSLDFRMALNARFKKRKCFSKRGKVNVLVTCRAQLPHSQEEV